MLWRAQHFGIGRSPELGFLLDQVVKLFDRTAPRRPVDYVFLALEPRQLEHPDRDRNVRQGIGDEMRVTMRRLRLCMAEQGADRVQPDAGARKDRGVGMPQVVDAQPGDVGSFANAQPVGLNLNPMPTTPTGEDYSDSVRRRLAMSWRAGALSGTMCSVRCLVVAPGLVQTPASRSTSAERAD